MSSDTATLTPTRGKKRSHNDENLSPSKTNSPAKARHAIGIASIRSFFAPASITEEEEESAEYEFDQTINSSPQKKLRLTNSIASATASASFITSTPKKTPKRPIKETSTPNKNSPARNLLEAFNALLFPHKVGPGKNLLDLFSPLRPSLNRSDSLENEKPVHEEIDIGDPNHHHETHVIYQEESICVSQSQDDSVDTTTVAATTVTIEEEEEFNPYSLIKTLPPPPPHKGPALPPKDPSDDRLTLVLDLDETLVHCATEQFGASDYEFDVTFNGTDYHVFARRRPYLAEFFKSIAGKFEIVLFTASQQVYANKLLEMMETSTHIHHRLFRDSCAYVEGNYIKDLRVLGRDLSRVVIVDNSPTAYGYQIDNGIPIESWFDDDSDQELLKLCPFLESLRNVEDVRPLVRSKFKTFELVAKA